jgi:hypothetical protein
MGDIDRKTLEVLAKVSIVSPATSTVCRRPIMIRALAAQPTSSISAVLRYRVATATPV